MKKKILLRAMAIIIAISTTACSQEDYPDGNNNVGQTQTLSLNVLDGGRQADDAVTRAAITGLTTSFEVGDQIGVYVVNSSGTITNANVAFTLGATGWTSATSLAYNDQNSYYAYYPYQSTLSGGRSASSSYAGSSADDFFSAAITAWTPSTTQNTKALFNAADLMVAKGVGSSDGTVTFSMTHKMGLALMEVGSYSYSLSSDATYTWSAKPAITGCSPYNVRGYSHLVVKPSSTTTILGNSITVAAGYAKHFTFTGSATHTLQVGDIYYSDGSISRPAEASRYTDKTPVGVISYLNDGTSYSNSVCQNKSHALVQALQTAGTGRWGPGEYINDEWVSTEEDPLINEPDMTDITTMTLLLSDVDGIANTDKLVAKHGDGTGVGQYYVAGYLARTYSAERPADATEWFLGAAGQWAAIFNGLSQTAVSKDVIDASTPWWTWLNTNVTYAEASAALYTAYKALFTNAGGWFADTWFWSSSEYSQYYAVAFALRGGESNGLYVNYNGKYYGYYVRPFLAF